MFQGLHSYQDESKDRWIFEGFEQSQIGIEQDSFEYAWRTTYTLEQNDCAYK